MKRSCPRCKALYQDGGPAKLPFCRACIASLPDMLRRGINNNAPGSQMRYNAQKAACQMWGLPEPEPF